MQQIFPRLKQNAVLRRFAVGYNYRQFSVPTSPPALSSARRGVTGRKKQKNAFQFFSFDLKFHPFSISKKARMRSGRRINENCYLYNNLEILFFAI